MECDISVNAAYIRGEVSAGTDDDVRDCYRRLIIECMESDARRALLVCHAHCDPNVHLGLGDGLRVMEAAGLDSTFKLALVAHTQAVLELYREISYRLHRVGVTAKAFLEDEKAALTWLMAD